MKLQPKNPSDFVNLESNLGVLQSRYSFLLPVPRGIISTEGMFCADDGVMVKSERVKG